MLAAVDADGVAGRQGTGVFAGELMLDTTCLMILI